MPLCHQGWSEASQGTQFKLFLQRAAHWDQSPGSCQVLLKPLFTPTVGRHLEECFFVGHLRAHVALSLYTQKCEGRLSLAPRAAPRSSPPDILSLQKTVFFGLPHHSSCFLFLVSNYVTAAGSGTKNCPPCAACPRESALASISLKAHCRVLCF